MAVSLRPVSINLKNSFTGHFRGNEISNANYLNRDLFRIIIQPIMDSNFCFAKDLSDLKISRLTENFRNSQKVTFLHVLPDFRNSIFFRSKDKFKINKTELIFKICFFKAVGCRDLKF